MVATSLATEQKRQIYPYIDILRGFAALSVLIYHVIELWEWTSWPTSGLLIWFRAGWMGVDLFFVISGFVIGLSAFAGIDRANAARARGEQTDGFQWSFAVRRVFRIVPLHYLTCLLFMIMVMPSLMFERTLPNVFTHAFFIHNWWPTLHGAINGANWSVATEMQFYLLMLFAAPLIKKSNWILLFLICFGVAWSWRFAMVQAVPTDGAMGTFPLFVFTTQLPGMMDEFCAGLLLAKFTSTQQGQHFLTRWWSPLATGLAALLAILITAKIYWGISDYWNTTMMVVFFKSTLALCGLLVVLTACTIPAIPSLLRVARPITYLGTISYGIYLWHLLVLLSLKELEWMTPKKALVYGLLATIILASFSWHFFEKPLLEKSRNYFKLPQFFKRPPVLSEVSADKGE